MIESISSLVQHLPKCHGPGPGSRPGCNGCRAIEIFESVCNERDLLTGEVVSYIAIEEGSITGDPTMEYWAGRFRAVLPGSRTNEHVIDFGPSNFGIQHPLSCRPNLLDCPVNVACNELAGDEVEYGRWVIELDHKDQVKFVRKLSR